MDFEDEILVAKDRIAVLIGKKGVAKRLIEKKGDVRLKVDSKEHVVNIYAKDALGLMVARNVIAAIGRGFNPMAAQKLFKDEYGFEFVNVRDFGAKSKKDLIRLRGRVIGEGGKSKNTIQRATHTEIVVYGKTVGIIGLHDDVRRARIAVERLLGGRTHETVYNFLSGEHGRDDECN